MKNKYSRREFVKQNSVIGLSVAMPFGLTSYFIKYDGTILYEHIVSQILFILLPTLLPEQHESVQCHIVAQMYALVVPAEQSRYSQSFLLFSYFVFYATGTFLSSLSA